MRRNWLVSLALLLALAALVGGIGDGALWDPYEVSVAELGRRIALNLLGGHGLAIPGADNSVPIRADLGRGELPFTSVALGFRLLGLSEWAGRLPLALWLLLGVGALYAALARLVNQRTALAAALVLATTPLYFLQARLLLGDAATLGCFGLAWAGLLAALFAPGLSQRTALVFGTLGALGLYGGFWCRGPIVSVAVPALSVALTAVFVRPDTALRRAFAFALTAVGLLALGLGVAGLSLARKTGDYSVLVGTALNAKDELATFDVGLGRLLHSAFPWSGLVPLVLALVASPLGSASARAVSLSATLGLGASLISSAWLGLPWAIAVVPAIGCFAALIALGLDEVEAERLSGATLGLSVAALALLIGLDLRQFPDKALVGSGLADVTLPEALQAASGWLWAGGGFWVALVAAFCLLERSSETSSLPAFRREPYVAVLDALQQAYRGNLVFAALVLEAALVGFLLLAAISERVVHLPQLDAFGSATRKLAAMSAVAVPCAALVPLLVLALRDATRVAFRSRSWLELTRAQGVLLAFAALGGVASCGFYPAVSRQVAPKQWVERYRALAQPGERLAMLGSDSAAVRYRGARDAISFEDAVTAFDWLGSSSDRRWLLLRRSDLAELNALNRAVRGENLPILDARASEVLLASNRLEQGERDESPLASLVLSRSPTPDQPLSAVLGRELELLGWSLRSQAGQPVRELAPGTPARLFIYYRVLAPLQSSWQTFVHLDGLQRRFNAEHELLAGKYPLRLWRANDIVVDATEISLEPHFSPGSYRLYFGLFNGDRRMTVTTGPASEDRIVAGTLRVR